GLLASATRLESYSRHSPPPPRVRSGPSGPSSKTKDPFAPVRPGAHSPRPAQLVGPCLPNYSQLQKACCSVLRLRAMPEHRPQHPEVLPEPTARLGFGRLFALVPCQAIAEPMPERQQGLSAPKLRRHFQ